MATGTYLLPNITKLDLLANGNLIGSATGFFLAFETRWYLVSNWHVFAGRNPETGQPNHAYGAVPDACRFTVMTKEGFPNGRDEHTINLGSADNNTAQWFQHPTMGQDCDIGAIEIDQSQRGMAKDLLSPGAHDPMMWIDLGDDLFIPGYPLGLSSNGIMPIWKRASLASSLDFGHGLDTYFYVDTATRTGMSGAPCLAIPKWWYYSKVPKSAKLKRVEANIHWRLLGIYSGRRNANDGFEAQVGLVWREQLLFEILKKRQVALVQLRQNSN